MAVECPAGRMAQQMHHRGSAIHSPVITSCRTHVNVLALSFTFFVIVVSKVILGLVACWMLMPRDEECPSCDARMLPLEAPHGRRRLYHVLHLQRRWCIECGGVMVGRRGRALPTRRRVQTPEVTTRSAQ